jgi:hypothetical protein
VTAVSLELGRSSAAHDNDDRESGQVGDTPGADGADQPQDDATADDRPRRSVLAPFMAAGGAGDSAPDDAAGNADDDPDSDSDPDPDPDPDEDETSASAGPSASVGTAEDNETSATPAARQGDDETAAASDGGGATGSSDDASTPAGATGPTGLATAAVSGVPAPRTSAPGAQSSAAGPLTDSGGPGKAGADVDGPLLEDADELRANWLRLQAAFVDDPHESVSDAADLVEHTAQALVGALRMRQQKLREMWDGGRQQGSGTADAQEGRQGAERAAMDTTEQLRLLMKRYRLLFNHICKS